MKGSLAMKTGRNSLKTFLLGILILCCLLSAATAEGTLYQTVSEKKQLYSLGDTGYLIDSWEAFYKPEAVITQAESFNKVLSAYPNVETYVYMVTSSRTMDFDHMEEEPKVFTLIRDNYPNSTVDRLKIDSIETYCDYFFTTDQHWRFKGSYQGYKDIIRMLLGEDEPLLEPVETVEFDTKFNGALNKKISRKTSQEKFVAYRFEFPEMQIKINGKRKKTYGKQDTYFQGKYNKKDAFTNHYSEFYGGDEGLIEFDTGNEDKPNIIIFSNSFSNAVNMLIASHFHHTYVIDMRHYGDDMKSKLNLTKSISNWDVQKVMLLGDGSFFSWGTTYR